MLTTGKLGGAYTGSHCFILITFCMFEMFTVNIGEGRRRWPGDLRKCPNPTPKQILLNKVPKGNICKGSNDKEKSLFTELVFGS